MGKIAFFVPGIPRTKGSQKWVKSKHTGKSVPTTNENLDIWVGKVSMFAQEAMKGHERLDDQAVEIDLYFLFERPKGHYGTGRNAGKLKPSAPLRHFQKPDPDKLERAIFDAMSGIVYKDDRQIDDHHTKKGWGRQAGVHITVKGESDAVQEG